MRRVFDVYVMPKAEDLSVISGKDVQKIVDGALIPPKGTSADNTRFGQQHERFFQVVRHRLDPIHRSCFSHPHGTVCFLCGSRSLFLLAIPPGISGVILFLLLTHTTLNIMSLMGVLMMTGIVVSDSILIVEFVGQLREQGPEAWKTRLSLHVK